MVGAVEDRCLHVLALALVGFGIEQLDQVASHWTRLWQQGADTIACTIEANLGKGATATVYRVAYAGKTRALQPGVAVITPRQCAQIKHFFATPGPGQQ